MIRQDKKKRFLLLFIGKEEKTEIHQSRTMEIENERDLSLHYIPLKITTKNKKDKPYG